MNSILAQKSGIKVTNFVKADNISIPIEQILRFDIKDLETYKEKFVSLKKKGIVLRGEFDDRQWKLSNAEDFEHRSVINFEPIFDRESCLALKSFSVVKLEDQRVTMSSTKVSIRFIHEFVKLSKNYRKQYWQTHVKPWLLKYESQTRIDIVSKVKDFLIFYPMNDSEHYLNNILRLRSDGPSHPRELPNYKSIIWFDYILDSYLQKCSEADKLKYFPIVLWWIITKIIPMRPIEFISLRLNCCEYDQNQNKYFLYIKRRKVVSLEKKMKSREVTQRLQVDKGMYDLIEEYKLYTKDDPDRKYLLSYKKYNESIYMKVIRKSAYTQKYNPNALNLTQLRDLLDYFYSEVVEKQFSKETIIKWHLRKARKNGEDVKDKLVRLQLGDTRHLSICYLVLQGHNPKTIAEMAWHDDINRHLSSYSSHAPEFVDANINILAQKIKTMRLNKCNVVNSLLDEPERIVQRALEMIKGQDKIQRYVEDSGCTSKAFPYECNELKCLYCTQNVFLTDNDDTNQEMRFRAESEKIQADINRQLDFIRCFTEGMKEIGALDFKIAAYDSEAQERLETASNNLKTRIIQKAILESYALQKKEENRKEGINNEG